MVNYCTPNSPKRLTLNTTMIMATAGMEQSATTDQGRRLATDILAGDQVSSFPSVIWLTEIWRCPR